jgi:hypothetical protein
MSDKEQTAEPVERAVRVYVLQHKRSDLMAAISPDLEGLVVHGRSEDEIERKLLGRVRDLLQAEGHQVISLKLKKDERIAEAGFIPPYIASASLAA